MSVFITGANGYIAKHIIVQLLKKNYKVIGTVRSQEKGDFITKQFNNDNFKYLTIPDYLDTQAFNLIIKNYPNISTVIHTAALVDSKTAKANSDLTDSAICSTKNILDSIKNFGFNINSVVLTSSIVSAITVKKRLPEFNETTWNDVEEADVTNNALVYNYGKTVSEKYAWDYINKNNQSYSFSTILPSYTFGPQAFDNDIKSTLNTSAEIINSIVTKNNVPKSVTAANFIDVRDVAKAHIIAFEQKLNQRLILANEYFTIHDMIEIIRAKYPKLELPSVKQAKVRKFMNNTRSKQALGFEFISFKQSVLDTVDQILKSN
jgi:NADPH-dependent methylglyoxal reductase